MPLVVVGGLIDCSNDKHQEVSMSVFVLSCKHIIFTLRKVKTFLRMCCVNAECLMTVLTAKEAETELTELKKCST